MTTTLEQPRFAGHDADKCISVEAWNSLTDAEREAETEALAARGLAPFRCWNVLRKHEVISLVPLEDLDQPASVYRMATPFEFRVDDRRIAGADEVAFIVHNVSNLKDARQAVKKFLESLADVGFSV